MTQINFLKRLEATPTVKSHVFLFGEPVVNEAALLRTAMKLGLKGDENINEISRSSQRITYSEGPFIVSLDEYSEAIRYYDANRWQVDDGESQFKLSDQEAVDIAEKFISKTNLVPQNEAKILKVTHLHVATMQKGSDKSNERIIDACVFFQRIIDGIPVYGPGGKVGIYIDSQGEVSGAERIWRQIVDTVEDIPPELLKPPVDAEKELKAYIEPKNISKVIVEDVLFGYFEQGPNETQKYLQPAYIMPLVYSDGKTHEMTMKSIFVTPAYEKSREWIMPYAKIAPKQSPREG